MNWAWFVPLIRKGVLNQVSKCKFRYLINNILYGLNLIMQRHNVIKRNKDMLTCLRARDAPSWAEHGLNQPENAGWMFLPPLQDEAQPLLLLPTPRLRKLLDILAMTSRNRGKWLTNKRTNADCWRSITKADAAKWDALADREEPASQPVRKKERKKERKKKIAD